jgi:predicted alpha-1,2-mannosidase
MRTYKLPILIASCLCSVVFGAATRDLTEYVNPFVGTGGHGHTYPGATVPFGMVQLSPDTYNDGWDWTSGYYYSDTSIMGFSHTHLSGTGIGDMLDVLIMPGTGPSKTVPGTRERPQDGYRSRFSHKDEVAQPGYYSVLLRDYNITAELTATQRAGIHKYTFPRSDSSHFIVDLSHVYGATTEILSSGLKIADSSTIVGERRVDAWAKDRHLYFVMKFSRPFASAEIVTGDKTLDASVSEASGKALKCLIHYKTAAGEAIFVKVGISAVSLEGAMANLDNEIPGWNFAGVRRAAHDAWQRELSKVTVETTDRKQEVILYTALYHTMVAPTLFDDVDGRYRGMDNQIHRLPAGQHNYSTFSIWDIYRALSPLYTLMQYDRFPDLVNCLIRMAQESPAGMPVWPLQGSETGCMTGYHSASIIAEACAKDFKGIDYAKVYPLMMKRAMSDDYRGLGYFRRLGYIPSDKEAESATKTMEYSYDAWAVARVARHLGRMDDSALLVAQASNYRNLWDKTTGFIRPRLENGDWAAPFDPTSTGVSTNWRDFTESNSWQGTWAAQHDTAGYIDLLGTREALVKKLDDVFNFNAPIKGEVPLDMTGLVGIYAHGNEPSHHVAYLYDFAGAAYKTQGRVRDLLLGQYDNAPDGLSGNEDCGQMSAWYVISSFGFYAVDPSSGNYVFGSPLFDKVTVDVGNGHRLVIVAKGNSHEAKYIQSVTFNGKPYDKLWFNHAAIANGGTLVFQMGVQPNKQFGAMPDAAPPSMTQK